MHLRAAWLSFFCVTLCTAESFVQSKKKLPSCSASKEACAQVGGQILTNIPETLEWVAEIQRTVVRMENQLLDGDKKGFMGQAHKEELHEYRQILERIRSEQEQFNQLLHAANQRLKKLEEKVVALR